MSSTMDTEDELDTILVQFWVGSTSSTESDSYGNAEKRAKAALQAFVTKTERGARIDEIKDFEKTMIAEFDELCSRVRTESSFGNSTKGKKDNFLDGAECMLTTIQWHRSKRLADLSPITQEVSGKQ